MNRLLAFLLLVCVAALTASSSADAACTCEKKSVAIGNCTTSFDVCGCLRHVTEWRYKAHADDVASGIAGPTAEWYKSSNGAATNAGKLLFDAMEPVAQNSWPDPPLCNCFGQAFQQNACNWYIEACFGFNSSADLENGLPSFRAFIKDTDTGTVVESPGYPAYYADATVAVESTIVLMLKQEPVCLKPNKKQLRELWTVANKVSGAFAGADKLKYNAKPNILAFDLDKP
jgi:hypothetical protein